MTISEIIKKFESEKTNDFPHNLYKIVEERIDGNAYLSLDGMIIIVSVNQEQDNNYWLHVSFSRRNRLPDYSDIQRVKRHFIGENKKAIMVFPEKDKHINIHKYCLHLWHNLTVDNLPDFTNGTNSI